MHIILCRNSSIHFFVAIDHLLLMAFSCRNPPKNGLSMNGASLNNARVRLALHEFVRIWIGRQEDWDLLERVELGHVKGASATISQLLKECEIREEARNSREVELLQNVSHLGSYDLVKLTALVCPANNTTIYL